MITREEWREECYKRGDFFDLPMPQISAIIDRTKAEMREGWNEGWNIAFEHLERRVALLETRTEEPLEPQPEPAPEEETVWVSSRIRPPFEGKDARHVYVWPDNHFSSFTLFECRVLPNGRIEPVAVRDAKELRKEVERLEGINRGFVKGRDELEAELERVKSDRDALARSYGELEKLSGAKFSEYDELREEYDKLLMLASRVRTVTAESTDWYRKQSFHDALHELTVLVAESDPKEEGGK